MKSTRTKQPHVYAIHTEKFTLTALRGQWFCKTGKRWELWDKFARVEVCVRRVPIADVLSVENKLLPKRPKFVIGQFVNLQLQVDIRVSACARIAKGRITGMNPNGTIMGVCITRPPEWFFALQRKRGLFASGPQDLQLFFDHTGNWTDIHGFNHFKIVQ